MLFQDYLLLVAQLEHQHRQGLLTLQRLWLYIQSTVHTMDILASICSAINRVITTSLLSYYLLGM